MKKYPKEYLEEIKLRLKVSNIVGKSVQLKKEAKNLLVFHHLKMKKLLRSLLMTKKDFIIALVQENTEIFLIF